MFILFYFFGVISLVLHSLKHMLEWRPEDNRKCSLLNLIFLYNVTSKFFDKFLSLHRYRHIYTSNGLTLHDIALSLANGQCVTTGSSDDTCAVCGNAGDLLLCRECSQAFHPCLYFLLF